MKGTLQQLLLALKPLGDYKVAGNQYKFNCPNCEALGYPPDKYNLELNYEKKTWHCWCCNKSGGLYKLVDAYGYKQYAIWFKQNKDKVLEKLESKILELPKTIPVYNHKDAYSYLIERNIHPTIIKQRDIRYCYEGPYKGCIIFPSYNSDQQLSYYVAHNYTHRKYQEKKSDIHVCFYENQIDKNMPIILTEGVYDSLSVPNSIPLLGLKITQPLLDFIANSDVILAIDSEVQYATKRKILKSLHSVARSVKELNIAPFKDLNDCYIKDSTFLKQKLNEFYK